VESCGFSEVGKMSCGACQEKRLNILAVQKKKGEKTSGLLGVPRHRGCSKVETRKGSRTSMKGLKKIRWTPGEDLNLLLTFGKKRKGKKLDLETQQLSIIKKEKERGDCQVNLSPRES